MPNKWGDPVFCIPLRQIMLECLSLVSLSLEPNTDQTFNHLCQNKQMHIVLVVWVLLTLKFWLNVVQLNYFVSNF